MKMKPNCTKTAIEIDTEHTGTGMPCLDAWYPWQPWHPPLAPPSLAEGGGPRGGGQGEFGGHPGDYWGAPGVRSEGADGQVRCGACVGPPVDTPDRPAELAVSSR